MNRLQSVPDSIQLLGLVKAVMVLMLPTVQVTGLQNGPFLSRIAVRVVLVAGTMQHYTALVMGQDLEGKRLGVIWICCSFHAGLKKTTDLHSISTPARRVSATGPVLFPHVVLSYNTLWPALTSPKHWVPAKVIISPSLKPAYPDAATSRRTRKWGELLCKGSAVCLPLSVCLCTAVRPASWQRNNGLLSPVAYRQRCEVDLRLVSGLRMREYTTPLLHTCHGVVCNGKQGRHLRRLEWDLGNTPQVEVRTLVASVGGVCGCDQCGFVLSGSGYR
jgi:hypothetical protein